MSKCFGNNDFVLEKENTEQFTVPIYERKHYFPENININEKKKKPILKALHGKRRTNSRKLLSKYSLAFFFPFADFSSYSNKP